MSQPVRTQINIDPKELKDVKCQCGHSYFETVMQYKIVPALYSQTGSEQILAVGMAKCTNCWLISSVEDLMRNAKMLTAN